MTAATLQLVLGVLLGMFGVLFALAKIGDYVLRNFHATHVKPVVAEISAALKENTTAMTHQTEGLARTDENLRADRAHAQATFDRMGKSIEDHEERISVLEVPPPPVGARMRPRRAG
jgi:hypothetical protein